MKDYVQNRDRLIQAVNIESDRALTVAFQAIVGSVSDKMPRDRAEPLLGYLEDALSKFKPFVTPLQKALLAEKFALEMVMAVEPRNVAFDYMVGYLEEDLFANPAHAEDIITRAEKTVKIGHIRPDIIKRAAQLSSTGLQVMAEAEPQKAFDRAKGMLARERYQGSLNEALQNAVTKIETRLATPDAALS